MMDSETVHGTVRSGAGSVPEAGRYSGDQWTLDGSGRSMATGAGERCNEKSSLHYSRSQKADNA